MTQVQWSPNLSVGNDEIDADHEKLIGLLNGLMADIEKGSGHEVIRTGLEQLMAETQNHFRHEERIMLQASYPELAYHQRLHESLMQEIREFHSSLESGSDIGPEVTEFLKNWLISHIMESDNQLGGYLQGLAAGQAGQTGPE